MSTAARQATNHEGGGALLPPSLQTSGEKSLFPADFAGIDDLVEACWAAVKDGLNLRGYSSRQEKIHLALHETLVNAWQHGNHRRPDLPIIFRWRFADDLIFEVLDAGQGFSCQTRAEPFTLDRLTSENGRGLAIIRFCSDNVCWERDGSHVIITFAHPLACTPQVVVTPSLLDL